MLTMDLREFSGSGLLYEVNRRVLHPHGLALATEVLLDDAGNVVKVLGFAGVIDARDDPEGLVFGGDDFATGRAEWRRYMRRAGAERLRLRRERLGFVQQTGVVPWHA